MEKILSAGRKGLSYQKLAVGKDARKELDGILKQLRNEGQIVARGEQLTAVKALGFVPATITRVSGRFGFAEDDKGGEIFIPGRFLEGALVGDRVIVKLLGTMGKNPDGRVLKIASYGDSTITGRIESGSDGLYVVPTGRNGIPMRVARGQTMKAKENDLVLAEVVSRGDRHASHKVAVRKIYGSADTSAACVRSLVEASGLPTAFGSDVLAEAQKLQLRGLRKEDLMGRLDLRKKPILTIDSADSKDLDDAISVEKKGTDYILGVHIADVSHFVTPGSLLDKEAFQRGTSTYFGDTVIPMLPKQLSNGLCSLNEGQDTLTFSCIARINKKGEIKEYTLKKSVICSRVKGVYSEVNAILDGTAGDKLKKKYKDVLETLTLAEELSSILNKKKRGRGAPELETVESKFIFDDKRRVVDIKPRGRGRSEEMIEDLMLCANECAARFGKENELPFVYRVHEAPTDEKIDVLKKMLEGFGIPAGKVKSGMEPKVLAAIAQAAKPEKYGVAVNYQVLRTMQKAQYSSDPKGHYGLALKDYAHFTSPIRRYADLTIHRIMGDFFAGENARKKYRTFAAKAAEQATATELRAMTLERDCEDVYRAEYISGFIGQKFLGRITSIAPHGIYVQLDNTVEGLVRIVDDKLKNGDFTVEYTDRDGNHYMVGDMVTIKVVGASVSAGQVDFEFV